MIQNIYEKVKIFIEEEKDEIFRALVIFFIGIIGFGLGYLAKSYEEKFPVYVTDENGERMTPQLLEETKAAQARASIRYAASSKGKKFYAYFCREVGQLKKENLLYFGTREEAIAAGFEESSKCTE